MKITLILACAGKGERAKLNKNKLLVPFNGETVLEKTLNVFIQSKLIDEIIVTSSKEDFEEIESIVKERAKVVLGGATRTDSVKNALSQVNEGIVLIHDGARPFVTQKIIKDSIESAIKFGSGVVAVPTSDTICRANTLTITDYIGKSSLYCVQTPQAFSVEKIKKAYANIHDASFNDDGEVYKNTFGSLALVLGDKNNIKLTFKEDFDNLLSVPHRFYNPVRFGVGFDCHKLVEGRKLFLGGIEIPHDKGLLGHSDADVLTHAIMDAILSSLSLRDIGYHFPDTDAKYKDANSINLLHEVLKLIDEKGYAVDSVSATIMAEKPKLLSYIPKITENLAIHLNLPIDNVGLTATTLEGLGFVGREEGICVHATAVTKQK